jgi:hypothetical protein
MSSYIGIMFNRGHNVSNSLSLNMTKKKSKIYDKVKLQIHAISILCSKINLYYYFEIKIFSEFETKPSFSKLKKAKLSTFIQQYLKYDISFSIGISILMSFI